MSRTSVDISMMSEPEAGPEPGLPLRARIYFAVVAVATAAVALPFLSRLQDTHDWASFVIFGSAAGIARLFVVRTPGDQAYHTDIVFLIPAALLLPPELLVLVAVVLMVPEWLKMRYRWYLQTFNILNYLLASMAVWFVGRELILNQTYIGDGTLRLAVAGLVSCIVFVGINHTLLALMLRFARGFSFRETGLFDPEFLTTDLVLATLGVAVYAFWQTNLWLVPFALAPLFLIHRSLSVPALQAEARVDPKTGLYNARYFASALAEEIGRTRRFERPMSLIMADLDLLRDINNSYGHLAGDAVLKGIAEVFRAQLRHYDVPARFGGEEFSILLPETRAAQALEIAERIRRAVAGRAFTVETSSEPIQATISIGVATYPNDGTDANELIHQADLAVYRAKLQGRNRTLGASSEPLLIPAERTARLAAVSEDGDHHAPIAAPVQVALAQERDNEPWHPRPHAFTFPLVLMQRTREAYLKHRRRSAQKLRQTETIQTEDVSLEHPNRLLTKQSTAAMESLSATVDARDSFTTGHSRRVRQLALAIGRELALSEAELDLLGKAALFHDIGKLAIPDAILLKPASLTPSEWSVMERHAEEGACMIDRLGFLNDAVPAIHYHHERFDGTGYPDRLRGDEIPLGARIIHVADALDSMLTTQIYRAAARPAAEALAELRRAAGTQFCPRCVGALERILPLERLESDSAHPAVVSAVAS